MESGKKSSCLIKESDKLIQTKRERENNEVNGSEFSRSELIEIVKRTGIKSSSVKSPHLSASQSEPSSPRKLFRRRQKTFDNDDDGSSSIGSSSTLTSEDGMTCSEEFNPCDTLKSTAVQSSIPSLIISQEDELDTSLEFRPRSGSQFYHESFPAGSVVSNKPVMYLPVTSCHSQQFNFKMKQEKKNRSLLSRLRHSFNKHRSTTTTRIVSDKSQQKSTKQRKWIDHEDELDPVSRPSYFRHIGHVVKAGPGLTQTIQLNRPPQGKFGVYIAQGINPESDSTSIFVSRFYQENVSMFYGSLLRPGDEIVAVDGQLVRDVPISRVIRLIAGQETVQLTILPITAKNIYK